MLGDKEPIGTLAVKDLAVAKKFYQGTLGLRQTDAQGEEAVTYQVGAAKLLVYRSQFAGSNKATAVTWLLGREVEKVVRGLRSKGVTFEHYQLPGLTLKGDIHEGQGMQAAWFKDPDGNIHALVSG